MISVIIPTYNDDKLLAYTLNSVVQQNIDRDMLECIVVDDGSAVDNMSVIKAFRKHLNLKYYYQEDKGNRVSRARNMGIENATGDICVFVDTGVILGAGCIQAHVDMHMASPGPIAIIGYMYCFDQTNKDGESLVKMIDAENPDRSIAFFKGTNAHLDLRENLYRKYNDRLEGLPAPWTFFWTCNVSARRSTLQSVGMFDTGFDQTWGFEDIELAYRMHESGVQIKLNRAAEAIHYPHDKENLEYKSWSEAVNRAYFHKKHNTEISELYLISNWFDLNDKLMFNQRYVSAELL